MAKGFKHGAGGGAITSGSGGAELTIVGGTTRPTKATQNMIWINTDVEITSCVLSATEPEDFAEGMVWIAIGDSGAIKIPSPVGDDWITVYPISTKQFINGDWIFKEAESYQGGEWIELKKLNYIFKSGTGAIMSMQFWEYSGNNHVETTSTRISTESISFTQTRTDYGEQAAYTVDAVDLTKIDTIYCKAVQTTKVLEGMMLFICPTTSSRAEAYKTAGASVSILESDKPSVYELDVSEFAGLYKIGVGGKGTGYVTDIWC